MIEGLEGTYFEYHGDGNFENLLPIVMENAYNLITKKVSPELLVEIARDDAKLHTIFLFDPENYGDREIFEVIEYYEQKDTVSGYLKCSELQKHLTAQARILGKDVNKTKINI